MPVSEIKLAIGTSPQSLQSEIDRLIAADFKPFPSADLTVQDGFMVMGLYKGTLESALSGVEDRLDAIDVNLTEISNYSATLAAKLNADAGVTDVNYVGVTLT